MAQPNAGQPKLVNMKVVYDETPEQMVAASCRCSRPAPTSSAACCGSTPDHIRAFRKAMDDVSGRGVRAIGTGLERHRP